MGSEMCIRDRNIFLHTVSEYAYSDTVCKKIFRLKKRPMNNPLIIHYYDLKKLKNDCDLNADFLKLYKRFCPGPITFILNQKKKSKISKVATNKKNTLAVRFPKHPVARTLLKHLKFPVAAPSANISSRVSAVTSSDVKDDFGKKIKYILEGGRSSVGVESTIIDLRKKPKILRLGGLEVETLQKILKKKILINTNPSKICLLYTSPSPRDGLLSRMPSSA